MTPLRQRFIEDLQLRNRAPKTIEAYVLQVRKFAQFYGRSPELLDAEQVHRYLLYLLHEKKASWVQYNQTVSALRFLYQVTCPRENMVQRLPYGKRRKRLPDVRSPEEVARFLAAVPGECPRLLLRLLYATGLRIGEGLQVRPPDLDDARGLLRVVGKGCKERLAPLPTALLVELKAYAQKRQTEWLFAGKDPHLVDCVPIDRLPAELMGHAFAVGGWCWILRVPGGAPNMDVAGSCRAGSASVLTLAQLGRKCLGVPKMFRGRCGLREGAFPTRL
jgi:site-specific recombinase XerD